MKKTVVTIAAGLVLAGGVGSTQASAAEYTVKPGDSLWKISNENNVSINQIKVANKLTSNLIFPNQKLEVGTAAPEATTTAKTYTIVSGDTLSKIALENSVTVAELKKWNELSSDLIIAGNTLKIIGDAQETVAPKQDVKESTSSNSSVQEQQPTQKQQPQQKSNSNQQSSQSQSSSKSSSKSVAKEITVTATAYSKAEPGMGHITASGIDLNDNPRVIAVDPSVIPLGSKVYVEGYGEAIAADTGGAIKGNKIDVHMNTVQACYNWGVKTVKVQILN
ncbi:LysM peptidoglycan-binding and 3D domain-containing protein [Listeria booriae]|uniref:LysM peptidoglycan-binding domain-containing protein n=1 Tax=Listeria booriae TaxID=1552123 RepID=A0A7X1CKM8_9LIST|nr:3D domain-containing protein [Listeria booriae]MBC1792312.1 LysM peptidoglycan-binding domain-containing protein [Listeria booriae]MBC1801406.1 LysM peptidoglycan-binding domain-containing protein [Listeria booriae]MBC1813219.1 LysM peptidoglycan-binding domain-containing protein [Listeria booriae]